jgi:bacillithiol biosynthesis cysteine-adding enzyme BshC
MDCTATRIDYKSTGILSGLVTDYLQQSPQLQDFYAYSPNWEGFEQALASRQNFATDRKALHQHLQEQYKAVDISASVKENIEALLRSNTFTILTAHQPNLFTGPLYFLFKILHVIRLAEEAGKRYVGTRFVPVYYMGNEDADFDELGHFFMEGQRHQWETRQTGAVGYMKVDDALLQLLTRVEGQLAVLPHGVELLTAMKQFFQKGTRIQDAMLHLVNYLFGEYGLIVIIPDSPALKRQMIPVFEKELFEEGASTVVLQTATKLGEAGYKVQANPREINLFYLTEGIRNRIEKDGDEFIVHQTDLRFSAEQMRKELQENPERFSPNVILRGIYQELILPNISFVGGGGETAYWLQLRGLFDASRVPFPQLILRNSFLLISAKQQAVLDKIRIEPDQLFQGRETLFQWMVRRESTHELTLNGKLEKATALYNEIVAQAAEVDRTLVAHVEALKTRAIEKLEQLEKKMLRAEKRKFSDTRRQLETIFQQLFPRDGLQERVENFMPFYARHGREWIRQLYKASLAMDQQFTVLHCD